MISHDDIQFLHGELTIFAWCKSQVSVTKHGSHGARRDHLRPKAAGEVVLPKVVPVLFFSGEEVGKLG